MLRRFFFFRRSRFFRRRRSRRDSRVSASASSAFASSAGSSGFASSGGLDRLLGLRLLGGLGLLGLRLFGGLGLLGLRLLGRLGLLGLRLSGRRRFRGGLLDRLLGLRLFGGRLLHGRLLGGRGLGLDLFGLVALDGLRVVLAHLLFDRRVDGADDVVVDGDLRDTASGLRGELNDVSGLLLGFLCRSGLLLRALRSLPPTPAPALACHAFVVLFFCFVVGEWCHFRRSGSPFARLQPRERGV